MSHHQQHHAKERDTSGAQNEHQQRINEGVDKDVAKLTKEGATDAAFKEVNEHISKRCANDAERQEYMQKLNAKLEEKGVLPKLMVEYGNHEIGDNKKISTQDLTTKTGDHNNQKEYAQAMLDQDLLNGQQTIRDSYKPHDINKKLLEKTRDGDGFTKEELNHLPASVESEKGATSMLSHMVTVENGKPSLSGVAKEIQELDKKNGYPGNISKGALDSAANDPNLSASERQAAKYMSDHFNEISKDGGKITLDDMKSYAKDRGMVVDENGKLRKGGSEVDPNLQTYKEKLEKEEERLNIADNNDTFTSKHGLYDIAEQNLLKTGQLNGLSNSETRHKIKEEMQRICKANGLSPEDFADGYIRSGQELLLYTPKEIEEMARKNLESISS